MQNSQARDQALHYSESPPFARTIVSLASSKNGADQEVGGSCLGILAKLCAEKGPALKVLEDNQWLLYQLSDTILELRHEAGAKQKALSLIYNAQRVMK